MDGPIKGTDPVIHRHHDGNQRHRVTFLHGISSHFSFSGLLVRRISVRLCMAKQTNVATQPPRAPGRNGTSSPSLSPGSTDVPPITQARVSQAMESPREKTHSGSTSASTPRRPVQTCPAVQEWIDTCPVVTCQTTASTTAPRIVRPMGRRAADVRHWPRVSAALCWGARPLKRQHAVGDRFEWYNQIIRSHNVGTVD
jgi:hypothetical protein